MNKLLLFILLLFPFTNSTGQSTDSPTFTLLKNAFLIDGKSEIAQKGDILLKDNLIEAISYESSIAPPKGSITYDLKGQYIIPGLIDAHVHFGTDPSGEDNLLDTQKRLAYLLKHGITTVRDMAGDTRYLNFLARSAVLNEIPSPDIYFSALMAGKSFFDDPRTHSSAKGAEPGNCSWMKAVDLGTNMPLAIAEAKGTGASGIKIYADLKAEVIQEITQEAHKQHLKVWAHAAVFPAKPQAIVEAGVDVVSHATLLAWEGVDYLPSSAKGRYVKQDNFNIDDPAFSHLIETMQAKGTILDATLATYQHTRFDKSIFQQGVDLTKLAYKHGVKIGVGTDMPVAELPDIPPLLKELEILVKEVGMSPMEALQSATLINAEMIGIENLIGSIEIGKRADLVILEANPLEDILNLKSIRYVVKHGDIFSNK